YLLAGAVLVPWHLQAGAARAEFASENNSQELQQPPPLPGATSSPPQVQFGAPAAVAPGIIRFGASVITNRGGGETPTAIRMEAPSVVAPAHKDTRVTPLGPFTGAEKHQRTLGLPPLGSADQEELK